MLCSIILEALQINRNTILAYMFNYLIVYSNGLSKLCRLRPAVVYLKNKQTPDWHSATSNTSQLQSIWIKTCTSGAFASFERKQ